MIVLGILGFIAVALLVYWLVIRINEHSEQKYSYEFFNMVNFVVTSIGYAFLYLGSRWYKSALESNGDLLNGLILVAVGTLLLGYVFYMNIKRTTLLFWLFVTLFQLLLYVGLSVVAFLALIMLLAALAETKPVYNLN